MLFSLKVLRLNMAEEVLKQLISEYNKITQGCRNTYISQSKSNAITSKKGISELVEFFIDDNLSTLPQFIQELPETDTKCKDGFIKWRQKVKTKFLFLIKFIHKKNDKERENNLRQYDQSLTDLNKIHDAIYDIVGGIPVRDNAISTTNKFGNLSLVFVYNFIACYI